MGGPASLTRCVAAPRPPGWLRPSWTEISSPAVRATERDREGGRERTGRPRAPAPSVADDVPPATPPPPCAGAYFCCCPCCALFTQRKVIEAKTGADGSDIFDVAIVCCCSLCALLQQAHQVELKVTSYDWSQARRPTAPAGVGWVGGGGRGGGRHRSATVWPSVVRGGIRGTGAVAPQRCGCVRADLR